MHEASGELKLWRPIDVGQGIKRCLYLSKAADAALQQFAAQEGVHRAAGLLQDLNRFSSGRMLRLPDDLKRLYAPPPEIWELRMRQPKPQFRLIGGFYSLDTLIVVGAMPRDALAARGAWRQAMAAADREWSRLFPGRDRLLGTKVEDYVTNTDPDGSAAVP